MTNEAGILGPRLDASRGWPQCFYAMLCSGNQALQLQGFSATEHSKCDGTKVRYGERDPGLWSLANERVGYQRSCHTTVQWNWIMHDNASLDYVIRNFFWHLILSYHIYGSSRYLQTSLCNFGNHNGMQCHGYMLAIHLECRAQSRPSTCCHVLAIEPMENVLEDQIRYLIWRCSNMSSCI